MSIRSMISYINASGRALMGPIKHSRYCGKLKVKGSFIILRRLSSKDSIPTDNKKILSKEYKLRSSLEMLILHYSKQDIPDITMKTLCDQSQKLSSSYILENAKNTVESLIVFNARRLREFRKLPYLVILNPSLSETYSLYLKSMALLVSASVSPPKSVQENSEFIRDVLEQFNEIHTDSLPEISKGFAEVTQFLSVNKVTTFLDQHLQDRILMSLIVHQHKELSNSLNSLTFEQGGKFNGVIKLLNIPDVINKNVELVNNLFMMKYDQSMNVDIETVLHDDNKTYLSDHKDATHPCIEYHLDYIFTELLKNSFRAQIENKVSTPVKIFVSISRDPSYIEIKISDQGKGIPASTLRHIFDYSFTTYETNEGESYKTLNVVPGFEGNTVAGMGFGLPLLRNYIEVFNASAPNYGLLSFQTYNGWGTDVYLKIGG
ncbi:uncharacterized protein PRCAT00003687001 [Priceomyces carsonii]|uniref:uncharacterized protein n=1 Tax=Priceomyces carsonii TaxID=28549 RepID=UPI002ED77DFC|nr:unnamed protein product [Priceomyces carsonii]